MNDLNMLDVELVLRAKEIIMKNFDSNKNNHTVGAAVRCKNGKVYLGVNVYLNHGACAELIAIGSAITAGEREFDCIVAFRGDGEGEVLPPCGNCRQMLFEYAPTCDVIIPTTDGNKKVKVSDIIPFAYIRKIR